MALKDITYKIKAETSQFESGMSRVAVGLDRLGSGAVVAGQRLGIAFAAAGAAIAALTVKQIQNIGANRDQATALGITYESLQNMALVANEASISQGELSGAMQKAQRAIVEAATGTGEAGNAFAALGLNVNALLQLQPDEQFNTIATALSGVENSTQRTALAMQIFGRGAGGLIPIFDDYAAKLKDAEAFNTRFNISLSEIDASMVDEAGDTFGRVTKVVEGLANTIAVQLSPIITELSNAFIDGTLNGEEMGKAVGGAVEWVSRRVDDLRLLIIGLDIVWLGLKWQALEVLTAIAKAFDTVVNAIENFNSNVVNLKVKAYEALGIQSETLLKTADALNAKRVNSDFAKNLSIDLEETKNKLRGLNTEVATFEKTSDKIARAQDNARRRAASSIKPSGKGGGAMLPGAKGGEAKDIGLPWLDPGASFFMERDYKKQFREMFDDAKDSIQETNDAAQQLGLTFSSAFEDAVVGGKKFSTVLQGLGSDIARLIIRKSITEPLANAASGLIGKINFGGFFADGGSPPVGKPSIVGERGAELFVPKTAGTIIPNHKLGGGGNTINLSYNFATGVETTARAEIMKAVPALVAASKRGVLDAINRGGSFSRAVGVQ